MTGFLVETYTPAAAVLAEIEARAGLAAAELQQAGRPVRYVRSIFVPGDETCFHLFEAGSAEVVREASERAGLSPQRIVEGRPSSLLRRHSPATRRRADSARPTVCSSAAFRTRWRSS